MRSSLTLAIVTLLLAHQNKGMGESGSPATKAPSSFELHDQFDVPHRLSFPATNVIILAIADRKGSEEVNGWIAALKPLYAGHVDFRGLADLAGVPGLLHARLRARFQETHKYPVMLDWSGNICTQFGYNRGMANILIIGRDGTIRARLCGSANPNAIASARVALEAALWSTNPKAPLPRPPHAKDTQ